MSDIFLCYSRTDAPVAAKLANQLEAEGWSVFLDVKTQVGRRWHREIERELHGARAVVVLWSAVSRDSDFVLEEADYGKRKDILFPALIERVEYPYGFGRIQTADLTDWDETSAHPGYVSLVEPLRQHLDRSPEQRPASAVSPAATAGSAKSRRTGTPARASPGHIFRDPLSGGGFAPLMASLPPGEFVMGSGPDEIERLANEGPLHRVTLSRPFALGVYAVTFVDYDCYCNDTRRSKPDDNGWGRGNRPVTGVSWTDAQTYCDWLSEKTGFPYALPSEAEWEYACRAGTTAAFHFGNVLTTEQANFNGTYAYGESGPGEFRNRTVPVGGFPANAFGLYDMHGNVWEWCADSWHEGYAGAPADGSAWEPDGRGARTLRGGSWFRGPRYCRSAFRNYSTPVLRNASVGFRVRCALAD